MKDENHRKSRERGKGMSAIQVIKQTLFIRTANNGLAYFSKDYAKNEEAKKILMFRRTGTKREFEEWMSYAALGAGGRQLGRGRAGEEAAVARALEGREHRQLAVEAEDRGVHHRDAVPQAGVVQQVPRGDLIMQRNPMKDENHRKSRERGKGMSAIQVNKQTLFIRTANNGLAYFSKDYAKNEEAKKILMFRRTGTKREFEEWMSSMIYDNDDSLVAIISGKPATFSDYGKAKKILMFRRTGTKREFEEWMSSMIYDNDDSLVAIISGKPATFSDYGRHLQRMANRSHDFEDTIIEKKLNCYYFTGKEYQPIVSNKQFEYYINNAPDKVFFVK